MVRLLLLLLLGYATAQNCATLVSGNGQAAGGCVNIIDQGTCTAQCSIGFSLLGNSLDYVCQAGVYAAVNASIGSCVADCPLHPWVPINRTIGNCPSPAISGTACNLTCLSGEGLNGNHTVTCFNGTWNNPTGTCASCGMNTYSMGDMACAPCPIGSVTQTTGSTQCECPPGSFAMNVSAPDMCTLCSPGEYQSAYGQGSCITCSGTFTSSPMGANSSSQCYCPAGNDGNSGCAFQCSALYFSLQDSFCQSCGAGALNIGAGQANCSCAPGSGSSATSFSPCDYCPAGYYQPATALNPQCISCPLGTTTSFPDSACCDGFFLNGTICSTCTPITNCLQVQCTTATDSQCNQCGPGTVSQGAFPVLSCAPCSPGFYRLSPFDSFCTSCGSAPATSPPAAEGVRACYCPTGYQQNNFSSSISCSLCFQGDYYDSVTKLCQPCDQNGLGFSPYGSMTSSNCTCTTGAGYSGVGATPPNLCKACGMNEFTNPQGFCTPCPAGSSPNFNLDGCTCNYPLAFNFTTNACELPTYYWKLFPWGLCNGQCGMGASLRVGYQKRSFECWQQASTGDVKVQDFECIQTPQPTDEQSCTQVCPDTPLGVSATAYYQSVVVNFTMPAQQYVVIPASVGTCNATTPCAQGICDVPSGQCRAPYEGYLAESEGGMYTAYKTLSTNDGISGILVPNIPNDVSVRFTVRAITVAVTQLDAYNTPAIRPLRSDPSSFSNSVTPKATLGCAVTCNHGICKDGSCVCDPAYFGATCDGQAMITISNPTTLSLDSTNSFSISYALSPRYDPYTGNQNNVDIFVYEAKCKNLDFCVPVRFTSNAAYTGSYTVAAQSLLTTDGPTSFFVRVFYSNRNTLYNDSAIFNVTTDSLCSGIACLNGGSCLFGSCICVGDWGGVTCAVKSDSCMFTSTYCLFGTCNTQTSRCDCSIGWAGDKCNYPANCGLRCKNNGVLNMNDGLLYDCTACICPPGYTGADCGTCAADCANGGTLKSCDDITYSLQPCNCPQFWDGPTCLRPYISLMFKMNVGQNNINADNEATLQNLISSNIFRSLGNPSSGDIAVYSVDKSGSTVSVEVRFYNNPNGLLLRERLIAALADPTALLYTKTTAISTAQPSDSPTQNSPSYPPDGSSKKRDWFLPVVIIIPIIGFIILVILIVVIVKSCSGGGGGNSGTADVPMATRS